MEWLMAVAVFVLGASVGALVDAIRYRGEMASLREALARATPRELSPGD
jgi:hypothetical protein